MKVILEIQIIGILFGLFLLYMTFLQYKRKEFTINEWGLWSALAVAFMATSLFPDVLDFFAKSIGVSRVMDLLIIIGFMFIIAATFYTYMVTRRTQRMLEAVVRKVAIEKRDDKSK